MACRTCRRCPFQLGSPQLAHHVSNGDRGDQQPHFSARDGEPLLIDAVWADEWAELASIAAAEQLDPVSDPVTHQPIRAEGSPAIGSSPPI